MVRAFSMIVKTDRTFTALRKTDPGDHQLSECTVLLLTGARVEARHNSYRAAINSCVTECDGCGSSAPQSPFLPRCKFLVTNNSITREGNASHWEADMLVMFVLECLDRLLTVKVIGTSFYEMPPVALFLQCTTSHHCRTWLACLLGRNARWRG